MKFSEGNFLSSYPFRSKRPVLVDVGAHNGSFSWPFVKKGWAVVAFEPERQNFKALKRNLRGLKYVWCIRKAVSNNTGQRVPFYVSQEHYGIHSLKPFHSTHRMSYKVQTIRIDDALKRLNIKKITLLKIDIEGADFPALQSFDFESHSPELVMVEFMDERSRTNFGYTHHDMARFMSTYGYCAFVSEWAPIGEYARKGCEHEPHTWIRVKPYPLENEPSWGNLIFVKNADKSNFTSFLHAYLIRDDSPRLKRFARLRHSLSELPGSRICLNMMLNLWRLKSLRLFTG